MVIKRHFDLSGDCGSGQNENSCKNLICMFFHLYLFDWAMRLVRPNPLPIIGITELAGFQIATRSQFLRYSVNTARNVTWVHEMPSEMWDMLEKDKLMPERDMIE